MRVRNFELGILLGMFGVFVGSAGLGQSQKSGALILVSVEGEVEFFDALGEPSEQKIEVGGVVPKDFSIATGAGSSVLCLFSNGTLMTLTEKTRMKVGVFKQEPFDADGSGGDTNVYRIDITGFNERRIVTPSDASDPAWSPLLR